MKYRTLFILALALLLPLTFGCDSDSNNGSGDPMEMTQATGVVFLAGEFCQNGIDGFTAQDEVAVDINLTNFVSGTLTIINMNTGDEAKCDMGESMRPVTPADFSCDSISSSNISGIQVSDQVDISIRFTEDDRSVEITNKTTGECIFVTLDSLNTN
jgi:hypothetical protein